MTIITEKICTIKECKNYGVFNKNTGKRHLSKGLCAYHYRKQYVQPRLLLRKNILIEKLGGKCAKCGDKNNLEFDHINRDRSFCIGNHLHINEVELYKELTKCQLLCYTCHKHKTRNEIAKMTIVEGTNAGDYHGTISTYSNYHCRCAECTKAWRDHHRIYIKEYRERKK